MRLINADRIQEEIKKCDGFAYDDYDKGMREGIRRALMRISETETVNLEEIQANEKAKTIDEFLERVLHDNCEGKCPPDVMYCYKCVAMRVAKQMKEGNGNEL